MLTKLAIAAINGGVLPSCDCAIGRGAHDPLLRIWHCEASTIQVRAVGGVAGDRREASQIALIF